MATPKTKLDQRLVDLHLAQDLKQARALIMGGDVLVDEVPVEKSGTSISHDQNIRIREGRSQRPFASRAGLKLDAGLDAFRVEVSGRIALDLGSSTGGFCDVLLKRGAAKIYAVDVGANQMEWRLRQDPRIVLHDQTNARTLAFETIGEKVGLITIDLSFISLTKIFKNILAFSTPETDWVVLIKPQFELDPSMVPRGGIVKESSHRQQAVESVKKSALSHGLQFLGLIESPLKGKDGNQEFLAHFRTSLSIPSVLS